MSPAPSCTARAIETQPEKPREFYQTPHPPERKSSPESIPRPFWEMAGGSCLPNHLIGHSALSPRDNVQGPPPRAPRRPEMGREESFHPRNGTVSERPHPICLSPHPRWHPPRKHRGSAARGKRAQKPSKRGQRC